MKDITLRFDGRNFEDTYDLSGQLTRVAPFDGLCSRKGDVILVRSNNVPEYGDHYILVVGHPIMKKTGFRPHVAIFKSPNNKILASYPIKDSLILLKLNCEARMAFHAFHGITFKDGQVHINQPQMIEAHGNG